MVDALDALGPQEAALEDTDEQFVESDDGPVAGGVLPGLAGIISGAAKMQSQIDRIGDSALTSAWDEFLGSLG
jgi:hypothetical protein